MVSSITTGHSQDTQTSFQQSPSENASQSDLIQHVHYDSRVIAANFFRYAPPELIYAIGRYLSPRDLCNVSLCNRPSFVTLRTGSDNLWDELARKKLPEVITMIQQRGFRSFSPQQKADINLVEPYVKSLGDAEVTKLLAQIEVGLNQAVADLRLEDKGGVTGRLDLALLNIDRWPAASTKLFGREDFNLKHKGWLALAAELAKNREIKYLGKARMFDEILKWEAPPTTHSATQLLDQMDGMSMRPDEDKRALLDSFLQANANRPPCFSFIGLLSLVPLMESLGPGRGDRDEFAIRYIFDKITAKAGKVSPEYRDKVAAVICANSMVSLALRIYS